MKTKLVYLFAVFSLLVISVNQCYGAMPQLTSAETKVKAQAAKAQSNRKTVKVKLKSGIVVKGQVLEVSTNDFKLEKSDTNLIQTIAYSDVSTIQEPSQLLNALKNIGKFTFGGTALGVGGAKALITVAAFLGVFILIVANSD